jgi:hypothetical protein
LIAFFFIIINFLTYYYKKNCDGNGDENGGQGDENGEKDDDENAGKMDDDKNMDNKEKIIIDEGDDYVELVVIDGVLFVTLSQLSQFSF